MFIEGFSLKILVCKKITLLRFVEQGYNLKTRFSEWFLRQDKCKPTAKTPSDTKRAVARTDPATIGVASHVKQVWNTDGVLDGFVHCGDPLETHGRNLLVRKLLTHVTVQFGVRL